MPDVNDTSSVSDPNADYSVADDGNQSVDAAGGDGRTIDNVRGELIRKNDKLRSEVEELKGMVSELLETQQKLVEGFNARPEPRRQEGAPNIHYPTGGQQFAPGPVSPFGAPREDLADYNDAQLMQALELPQLSPYQKDQIKAELQIRGQIRTVESVLDKRSAETQRAEAIADAERAALAAFPALREKNSEFAKRVEAELAKQRKLFGQFPTDKLDVANRIARDMGVEVQRGFSGFSAAGSQDYKPGTTSNTVQEPDSISDEEAKRLAQRFETAMPIRRNAKGKPERVKFNIDRLKERSKVYKQSEGLFKSKKVIG